MAGAGAPQNVFQGASAGLNMAGQTAGQLAGFRPQTLAGTNLGQYMNPFQGAVINRTMADMERQRQQMGNATGAAATAAGAFGGSRHGVADALTNQGFQQTAADTIANLRMANFGQAQQGALADIANSIQGAGIRSNAAGMLGNLSNLGFGMGQAAQQGQMQAGGMQQQLMQQLINAAKGQFAGFTGAPGQSLAMQLAALGGVPYPQSQTTQQQPGLLNFLSLGMGLV